MGPVLLHYLTRKKGYKTCYQIYCVRVGYIWLSKIGSSIHTMIAVSKSLIHICYNI